MGLSWRSCCARSGGDPNARAAPPPRSVAAGDGRRSSDRRSDRRFRARDRHATRADLFAPSPRAIAMAERLAIAGALAVALGGLGLLARTWPSGRDRRWRRPQPRRRRLPPCSSNCCRWRHSQDAEALTITGLVQNPRSGTPLSKITATAIALRRRRRRSSPAAGRRSTSQRCGRETNRGFVDQCSGGRNVRHGGTLPDRLPWRRRRASSATSIAAARHRRIARGPS